MKNPGHWLLRVRFIKEHTLFSPDSPTATIPLHTSPSPPASPDSAYIAFPCTYRLFPVAVHPSCDSQHSSHSPPDSSVVKQLRSKLWDRWMNEYNNPSFVTMFQRALLNTCISTCFGSYCTHSLLNEQQDALTHKKKLGQVFDWLCGVRKLGWPKRHNVHTNVLPMAQLVKPVDTSRTVLITVTLSSPLRKEWRVMPFNHWKLRGVMSFSSKT
jgi:hypothetical protein